MKLLVGNSNKEIGRRNTKLTFTLRKKNCHGKLKDDFTLKSTTELVQSDMLGNMSIHLLHTYEINLAKYIFQVFQSAWNVKSMVFGLVLVLCYLDTGLSKDIRCHMTILFLNLLHMVISIFLQGLCEYIWVNILTLSPHRVHGIWTRENAQLRRGQ